MRLPTMYPTAPRLTAMKPPIMVTLQVMTHYRRIRLTHRSPPVANAVEKDVFVETAKTKTDVQMHKTTSVSWNPRDSQDVIPTEPMEV